LEDIIPGTPRNISEIPPEEYLTFRKVVLPNKDVGYVTMKDEFF